MNNKHISRICFIPVLLIILIVPGFTDSPLDDYDKIKYDSSRESSYEVTIKEVNEIDWISGSGNSTGISLIVYFKTKEYFVPVAPFWYMSNKCKLKPEQSIIIIGVMQKIAGRNIILPKVISVNRDDIFIRNYDGKTFWDTSDNRYLGKDNSGGHEHHSGNDGPVEHGSQSSGGGCH